MQQIQEGKTPPSFFPTLMFTFSSLRHSPEDIALQAIVSKQQKRISGLRRIQRLFHPGNNPDLKYTINLAENFQPGNSLKNSSNSIHLDTDITYLLNY